MENKREEILGLKRLVVGVIVSTLLITMLPIENFGGIFAKAEEISIPSEEEAMYVPVESSTEAGSTETVEDTITNALYKYGEITDDFPNGLAEQYPMGMVVKVYEDIDLSNVYSGGIVPKNIYFVFPEDTTAKTIYGFENFVYNMETAESLNIYVSGDATIYAVGKDSDWQPETTICEWYLQGDVHVTTASTVNTDMVRFHVEQGASVTLLGEGKTIELLEDSPYYYTCYNTSEGQYSYSDTEVLVEEIGSVYIEDGVFDVNAYTIESEDMGAIKTTYAESAVKGLPEGTVLKYYNGCNIAEYPNPGTSFSVDEEYGMYSLSVSDKTMTIYAPRAYGLVRLRDATEGAAILEISGEVLIEVMDESGEMYYEPCSKIVLAEGFAPETVLCNCSPNEDTPVEKKITEIYFPISEKTDETEYEIHLTNRSTIPVFSDSAVAITVVDEDTVVEDISKLWIRCSQLAENFSQEIIVEGASNNGGSCTSGVFIEAGTEVTVKPADAENGTIYNAVLYRMGTSSWENITYNIDKSLTVRIPNYACDFEYQLGTIEEESSYTVKDVTGESEVYSEDVNNVTVHAYKNDFVVTPAEGFLIFDTTGEKNDWSNEITVSEEGYNVVKTYYVLNQMTTVDPTTSEILQEDGYGKISKITHTYTLDKATPEISAVVAKDADGNTIALSDAETVWTNSPSVTLTVTADAGAGMPIAGYKFGTAAWQTGNSYTYTSDGLYNIEIHVKDEFDVKLESVDKTRTESGTWQTSFGIDSAAPILMFTDAQHPTSSALKSDAQYEGNLHMVCDDGNGSGFAEIHLYKKTDSEWNICDDLLIATEEGSYIAPTAEEEIYKIEVSDKAGNKTVYDNVTMLGYKQDVEVTVGKITGAYGEDLEIEVTVKNASTNTLEFSLFGLREDATNDAFAMEVDSVLELAAGESFTTKILLPKGTDTGSYDAMLDLSYTNIADAPGQNVAKVYSQQFTATVEKAKGTATVTVEDISYGEKLEVIANSDTNGTENVVYYYKKADATDDTYTTVVPTEAGTYRVKAVFPATTNYNEVVVEAQFVIEAEPVAEPETPAEPEDSVVTLGEGKVSLKAGTAYQLEEGNWIVTGDETKYIGGIVFYVEEDGEYEFTKQ